MEIKPRRITSWFFARKNENENSRIYDNFGCRRTDWFRVAKRKIWEINTQKITNFLKTPEDSIEWYVQIRIYI